MLTASKLINHLEYSAPKQQPRREWFSWHAMIVSGIVCVAVLIILMLMIPVAHDIYMDFGIADSGITQVLWIASTWLERYHRWALILGLPICISLITGFLSHEPRKHLNLDGALILSVPLACLLVGGTMLISALPFVRFHHLLQDQGKLANGTLTFPGFAPLFRYLSMREIGSPDPNAIAAFTAACTTDRHPWTADNHSELLVITPQWAPSNTGQEQLRSPVGNGNFYIVLRDLTTNRVSLVGTATGSGYSVQTQNGNPAISAHWHMSAAENTITTLVWNGQRFQEVGTPITVIQEDSAAR